MPYHEVLKALDLWRRFHKADVRHRSDRLGQFARERQHQIAASDGGNRRHKERNTEGDSPSQTKICQGSIKNAHDDMRKF
jgi:hypothetical protein